MRHPYARHRNAAGITQEKAAELAFGHPPFCLPSPAAALSGRNQGLSYSFLAFSG